MSLVTYLMGSIVATVVTHTNTCLLLFLWYILSGLPGSGRLDVENAYYSPKRSPVEASSQTLQDRSLTLRENLLSLILRDLAAQDLVTPLQDTQQSLFV